MTNEDQKKLEAIQSTVLTDGWKFIMEDLSNKQNAIKEEFTNPGVSLEMLRFGQGRLAVYREFLGLAAMVDNILQQAYEDAQEEANG